MWGQEEIKTIQITFLRHPCTEAIGLACSPVVYAFTTSPHGWGQDDQHGIKHAHLEQWVYVREDELRLFLLMVLKPVLYSKAKLFPLPSEECVLHLKALGTLKNPKQYKGQSILRSVDRMLTTSKGVEDGSEQGRMRDQEESSQDMLQALQSTAL
ncbi:hypothetical protein H920_15388 [Fukomys damarensis]|uniref:Uncharacterized protein n=1 Tax=Fukomys damarensis TaxID=885580 RepID=A0A091CYB8_FUKDA|nr:hypothetical protein H920_15388 [Fukomys damarensis]